MIMKKIFIAFLIILSTSISLHSQNINVTSSPSPVPQGHKMRVTIDSSFPLEKGTIIIPKLPNTSIKRIAENLFTGNIWIPDSYPAGRHTLKVYLKVEEKKVLMVKVKFEVVKKTPLPTSQSPELEQEVVNIQNLDLNLKIDELENDLDRMNREKRDLLEKLENLKAQLSANQTDDRAAIEKEIARLEDQLKNQEAQLEIASKSLQDKLIELAKAEKELQAKEQRLQEIEAVLESQEEILKDKEKALENTEKALSAQQSQLITKKDELKKVEDSLLKNTKLLNNLNSALNKEKRELGALQGQLNSKESKLKQLAQSLSSEDTRIKQLQSEINRNKASIQSKESQISKKESNLLLKEQALNKETKKLMDAQVKVEDSQRKLNRSFKEYDQKNRAIQIERKQLTSERNELNQKERQLARTNRDLTSKEKRLSTLNSKLSEKNKKLAQLESKLSKERSTLTKTNKSLEKKERDLKKRSTHLTRSKQILADEKTKLAKIKSQFESEKKRFSNAQKTASQLNQKERNDLKKQHQLLDRLQTQISKKESQLGLLAEDQKEREIQLITMEKDLDSERSDLANKNKVLSKKEHALNTLKNNIDTKHASIEALQKWIENKTSGLESTFNQSKSEINLDHEKYKTQFERLESLTRLLQERSRYLKEINAHLLEKNHTLHTEVTELKSGKTNFSIESFMGYKRFRSSRNLSQSAELGIRFIGQFDRSIDIASSIGLVPTLEESNKLSRSETIYTYSINTYYTFLRSDRVSLYSVFGVNGDFNDEDSMDLNLGIGTKYLIDENTSTRINVIGGKNMLASIGFEKKIIFNQSAIDPYEQKSLAIQESIRNKKGHEKHIETNLVVPESHLNYMFKLSEITPTFNHWANAAMRKLTALGIVSDEWLKGKQTLKEPLNKLQMVQAIARTHLLTNLPQETVSTINFSLVELPGIPHQVSIKVMKGRNTIASLVSNKPYFTGNHTLKWNGSTQQNRPLSKGLYSIELTVTEDTITLANKKQPIYIETQHEVPIPETPIYLKLADVTDETNLRLIQEWLKFGNSIHRQSSKNNAGIFEPDRSITRLEFILNVSELLQKYGATNLVKADLSPYKDTNKLALSKEDREKLELYIGSLGYGGDDKKKLRPNEIITLSEASTILNRLIRWLEDNKELELQFI